MTRQIVHDTHYEVAAATGDVSAVCTCGWRSLWSPGWAPAERDAAEHHRHNPPPTTRADSNHNTR